MVYHISKISGNDTFNILASKIVNGVEEEMGISPCILNKKSKRLISNSDNGIWTFDLGRGKLSGTLVFRGNLYRIITLAKQD